MSRLANLLGGMVLIAFSSMFPAAPNAQDIGAAVPEMPKDCSLHAQSEMIRIVICADKKMDAALLGEAGRAACGDKLPCGAWIWTTPETAPTAAPDNHDGLTQEQITSSKGVWVAEKELFMSIDKVE